MKTINIIKSKFIVIGCFFASTFLLQANPPVQETPKPLELPNFIIEGVEQLNVRSGIKQMPTRVEILGSQELDSLNSLEKQTAVLIDPDPLPTNSISRHFHQGFVRGALGLYATPEIEIGIGRKVVGYELFANAGLDHSAGDAKRSDFTRFFVKGHSDFIAPDKFFIFGGSRTRTSIFLDNAGYNMYANANSAASSGYYDRSATRYGFNVDTDGSWDNVMFNTGIRVASLQLSADSKASDYHPSSKAFENNIHGYLKIKNMWNNYLLAANALVDFNSLRTDAMNFLQFAGSASYFTDDFTIAASVGFQSAVNSDGKSRGGLLLQGDIEYRLNKLMTIKGTFASGLENRSYSDYFKQNPYLDFSTPVDFMYNIALINGSWIYHPNERFTFSGGLKWRVADRLPFFDDADNNAFTLRYDQGTILEIIPEIIWLITPNDRLSANMTYAVGALNNFNGQVPYYPYMKTDFAYRKVFLGKLGTQIGLTYVGERDVSVENNDKIDGFMNLNFSADYTINNNFILFANFHNLTSSNIYIWNNYKERGLFANFGAIWQF